MCPASLAIGQDVNGIKVHGLVKALIIEDSKLDQLILKKMLEKNDYDVRVASNGNMAIEMFVEYRPDIVFMNVYLTDANGYDLTKIFKSLSREKYVPIIFVTGESNNESLEKCVDSGGDDFIVKPIREWLVKAKLRSLLRIKKMHDELLVQKQELLSRSEEQLKDLYDADKVIHNIHKPRFYDSGNISWSYIAQNILSGDIVCSAINPSGEHVVLVGDNTGHGLPAAIGSMITCETFYSMVNRGFDIKLIIEEINKKLYYLLPTDRFLSACIMEFNDTYDRMKIWTAGVPSVLICNSRGELKEKIPSMNFPLGIMLLNEKEIAPVRMHLEEGDRVYSYTDGLTEVFDESGEMYGEQRLLDSIKSRSSCHLEKRIDAVINDARKFNNNAALTDDILLLEISCNKLIIKKSEKHKIHSNEIEPMNWHVKFELQADVIRKANPIPAIIQAMVNIQGFGEHREKIFLILTEIYSNAVEHGILHMDSRIKDEGDGFLKYYELCQSRLNELVQANVVIDIQHFVEGEKGVVSITIEDDGAGFDYTKVVSELGKNTKKSGHGIRLLSDLCRKCEYSDGGRKLNVEYEWQLENNRNVA